MSKQNVSKRRALYTVEFKLEAVRLVKTGQEASVTARVLGVPKQTLSNWVRLADKGALQGAGERPVSAEQMELARLRAELARVKMERDILKKATAAQAACAEPDLIEVRLDFSVPSGVADHADLRGFECQRQRLLRTPAQARTRPAQPSWRAPQQRIAAGAHPRYPRRSQRRIRLAKGMEGVAGARYQGGQRSRPAADESAWHQGPRQEEIRRHHGQQARSCSG